MENLCSLKLQWWTKQHSDGIAYVTSLNSKHVNLMTREIEVRASEMPRERDPGSVVQLQILIFRKQSRSLIPGSIFYFLDSPHFQLAYPVILKIAFFS